MTFRLFIHRQHFLLAAVGLVAAASAGTTRLHAQINDERTRQQLERLSLQDYSLRSSIQGQRIDRQAEVARLEARIVKLEKLTRGLAPHISNSEFITLVLALEEQQAAAAASNAPVENKEPVGVADAQASPETEPRGLRLELLQLIARDYIGVLKNEMLEARISLFEESQQLNSLQRLIAKGLATRPQLELQELKQRSAEARFARLQQQQAGLRELFPTFFPMSQPTTTEEETELPEPSRE